MHLINWVRARCVRTPRVVIDEERVLDQGRRGEPLEDGKGKQVHPPQEPPGGTQPLTL